jgi:hypothetical protein
MTWVWCVSPTPNTDGTNLTKSKVEINPIKKVFEMVIGETTVKDRF